MLVTHEDFEIPERRRHIENTLHELLSIDRVIPVFNENDSVAIEEIRFGDNDALSAGIAKLTKADLLILLTSVDGLIPPSGQGVVDVVHDLNAVISFAKKDQGKLSVGGMKAKLMAVKTAVDAGVQTIIANGRKPEQLLELISGRGIGTRFLTKK